MGTYLTLGIATRIHLSPEGAANANLSTEKAATIMATFGMNPKETQVWEATETGWALKPQIMKTYLPDLLQKLIRWYGDENLDKRELAELYSILAAVPDDATILARAEAQTLPFYLSWEAGAICERFPTGNISTRLQVSYDVLNLVSVGKVYAETTGGMFRLFQKALAAALPENPLAKALQVYISG